MKEAWLPILVALGTALGLRIIDVLLPKGKYLKPLDRWLKDDDDETGN